MKAIVDNELFSVGIRTDYVNVVGLRIFPDGSTFNDTYGYCSFEPVPKLTKRKFVSRFVVTGAVRK